MNYSYKRPSSYAQRPHKKRLSSKGAKKRPLYLRKGFFKLLFVLFAFLFVIGGIFFFALLAWTAKDLPDPNSIIQREVQQSTKIYDKTGTILLYEIHGNQKRTIIDLEQIPEHMKWATIVAEDRNFHDHKGFTVTGFLRAAIINTLTRTKSQGGSTITQQLVKNAILTPEKTYTRKLKELILSYQIENKFTKDQILKMYLNEIPYGSTAYGIEAASQTFFGKSTKDVSIAQSAILAALPKATTYYSPYGNNKEALFARQHYILNAMHELGYISKDELDQAKNEQIAFRQGAHNILAPHFVMYVKNLLTETYGEKLVEQGGLTVITSLDMSVQDMAEKSIAEHAKQNEEQYLSTNASLVAIDPQNGHILAMVGSKDYFNASIDGNVNVSLRPRQPGSSFKPFVYAIAFDKGYSDRTILFDVKTNFAVSGAKDYSPQNYDGKEDGPMSIRKALAGSKNIPAVKALYLVGLNTVLEYARLAGYTTFNDPDRFGLSIVLGGAEVKLLEHTAAYGAFAQDGIYHAPAAILEVKDSKGKILERYRDQSMRIFKEQSARIINDILSDNDARSYVFGPNSHLHIPGLSVAAKTGTTNDYRDAWTMGYTTNLVVGVWAGNNNNTPMNKAGGSRAAAPIWNTFMKMYYKDKQATAFKKPSFVSTGKAMLDGEEGGEIRVVIDKISRKRATEYTPEHLREEKIFKEMHTILHYVDKSDPLGPIPTNPGKDPQYMAWELGVQQWMQEQGYSNNAPPQEEDDIHLPELTPRITIVSPAANTLISSDTLEITVDATAPRGVYRVDYYINNILLAQVNAYPFSIMQAPLKGVANGTHMLKAYAFDDVENVSVAEIPIIIDSSLSPYIDIAKPKQSTIYTDQLPLELSIYAFAGSNARYEGIKDIIISYEGPNGYIQEARRISYPTNTTITIAFPEISEAGIYHFIAEMVTESQRNYKSSTRTMTIDSF